MILQPLTPNWSFDGFARRLEYELRVEWDPSATGEPARVVRELIRASGPPLGPPDQPDCMDPRTISPEPLAFLLPDRRNAFNFDVAGSTRIDGREAVMLDYRVMAHEQPMVEWTGHCAWVDLSGRTRGRVWADAATFEILRFDEHLVGLVDIPGPARPARLRAAMVYLRASRYFDSLQARDVRESGRNPHATGADREHNRRPELRHSAAAHHTDL